MTRPDFNWQAFVRKTAAHGNPVERIHRGLERLGHPKTIEEVRAIAAPIIISVRAAEQGAAAERAERRAPPKTHERPKPPPAPKATPTIREITPRVVTPRVVTPRFIEARVAETRPAPPRAVARDLGPEDAAIRAMLRKAR